MHRPRYPLKVSEGEIVCPRKSGPFPAVIGAMACVSLHRQSPARCDHYDCNEHIGAVEHAEHLRKHAEEAVNRLLPVVQGSESDAEDATRSTP